jgi:ElaB/YqjD/DUF883 family membrane-anchored ribosome-binding protein
MSADRDLNEAYQEWRRLAEAEGEAIRTCNWNLLSACQKALHGLQQRIVVLSEAARREWSRLGTERLVRQKTLEATVRELIELERNNETLLNSVREAAREKIEQLDQAGRNLKRIRRSYVRECPTAWTSFS